MKKVFLDCSNIIRENSYKIDEVKHKYYSVSHFKVDSSNEKALKRIKGDYYTINFDYFNLEIHKTIIIKELMKILKMFLKEKISKTLIIGLGNSSIICDSLGINTTNKIMATNHYKDFLNIPKVALFNPEVTEKTGISSFSLIEMVVKKLKPTVIIMIDTLATENEDYLNNCIEINNTGIIPGSAIKDSKKIDYNTFNIPVIAIGVPLVLSINKRLYTSPNIKEIVNNTSDVISKSLNNLFF